MRIRAKQLAFAATAAVALLAVSLPASADVSGRAVKIGVMYPLTGKGATWGKHAQIGIRLAVEEVNAAGGIGGVPIKLVEYDSRLRNLKASPSSINSRPAITSWLFWGRVSVRCAKSSSRYWKDYRHPSFHTVRPNPVCPNSVTGRSVTA